MASPTSSFALTARYVFPGMTPPLSGGVVAIDGPRIAAVGGKATAPVVHDLGNVAILPGFVNAHTHLEFSDLEAPLGRPSIPLPDWIRQILAHRRERSARVVGCADPLAETRRSLRQGVAESIAGGVTTLGEIAAFAWTADQLREQPVEGTVFWEHIGFSPELVEPTLDRVARWVETVREREDCNWRPGISPHAPYSVHPELVAALSRLSASVQTPLAMHLAESPEELELLRSGGGPFVELLKELGVWRPETVPRGARPMDYLQQLAGADRALVVHGNFLDAEEIAFLGARADRMSVVFCPRTHAYFDHARYPLAEMLAAGVNVTLGTDSRASSPDLCLLEELRFVASHFPDVPPQRVLSMGASAGARALGLASELGDLSPGKLANLAVVRLPERQEADPFALLFDSAEPVQMTFHRGRLIHTIA